MTKDECDDAATLEQQAFSVYCDQVVRDAVEKNDKLRAENASMETARKMLTHMTIYKCSDKFNSSFSDGSVKGMEINLQQTAAVKDDQGQQNTVPYVFVYNIESQAVEFPYEDAPLLYCEISNVKLKEELDSESEGALLPRLRLLQNEDDESVLVELEFYPVRDVKITGILKNFAGTLQDVKEMIQAGEFSWHFMKTVRTINAKARQTFPKDLFDCLDGAILSLKTVEIAKRHLHSIHVTPDERVTAGLVDGSDEQEYKELLVLVNTNKKNESLRKATVDRQVLKARNSLLKHSREVFQTLTAHYPGTTLRFKTEQGSIGRMLPRQAAVAARAVAAGQQQQQKEEAAWVISTENHNKDESTILLSIVSKLQLVLANVTWFTEPPIKAGLPVLMTTSSNDRILILKYSNDIEAIFGFDESLDDVDVDNLPGGVNLLQYIREALLASYLEQGVGGGHWQRHHHQQQQGPQFTMRLLAFHIQLSSIQSHLDALGIKVHTDDEAEVN